MRSPHPLLERLRVKNLRRATFLAFDQGGAHRLQAGDTLLLPANQVADAFAVVGVMPRLNLGLDPAVLLVGEGDGFADGWTWCGLWRMGG